MRFRRWVSALSWLLFLAAAPAAAQTDSATIRGLVSDPSGATVADALVTVRDTSQDTDRQTASGGDGLFAIGGLPPRAYVVTVSKAGFQTWSSGPLPLNGGDTIRLTVTLPVGRVEDAIVVNATAVDEAAGSSVTIPEALVAQLPLNGRTFQSLLALVPGVTAAPAGFETQGQFSVNGQRTSSNYFTIDGVSANFAISSAVRPGQTAAGALPALSVAGTTASLVPLDAVQEFRVRTSAYAAEYGRQPGAQVQITTRSGGNAFHGSVSDYLRNDAFDATDWFANRSGLDKPPLRQHDFAAVLGGPVLRDRTFFFVTYEGLRLRQPKTATVAVPSMATREAVPSALKPYVDAIAQPNGPDLGNGLAQFSASYADPTTLDATSFKVDHRIGALGVFGRVTSSTSESETRQTAGFAPNTIQVDRHRIWTTTLGANTTLRHWMLESRVNVSGMEAATRQRVDDFGNARPLPESALYPSFTGRNESAFFFQMTQGVGFVDGTISQNRQRQINVVQSATWSPARHLVKVGADLRWMLPSVSTRDFDVFYRFANPAALVSGVAQTAGVRGFPVVDFQYANYSLFAQDQFELHPSLTLTYGARWEVNPGPVGRNDYALYPIVGTFPDFAIGSSDAPFYQTTFGNVGPRVGAVWRVHERGTASWIVRGGFGVFHDLGAGLSGSLSDNLYQRERASASVIFPLAESQLQRLPIPAAPPYVIVTGTEPDLQLPYSRHSNVTLEYSQGAAGSYSIGWIGAEGRNLLQTQFFLNPNTRFQQLRFIRNGAESRYHALQLRMQRTVVRELSTLISYTWSRSRDNTSGDDTVFSPPQVLDRDRDWGPSDFDVPHAFNAGVTWLPQLDASTMAVRRILNGWALSAVWRSQSALPVTPFETRVFPGLSGSIRTRPDMVDGVPLYLESAAYPGGRALNPAAFRRVTDARQGTLGRNALRGFPLHQLDLAVHRQVALPRQLTAEIRIEAFNLLNHPNFAAPTTDLLSPFFGVSQQNYGRGLGSGGINAGVSPLYQVGTPRSLQLAAKLSF